MQKRDLWKIHLGRRIELDEEDLDGSMFIEDLLEDALMYPMLSKTCKRTYDKWETVEASPGIWLTRLQDHKGDELDHDDVLSEDDSSEHDCSSQFSASAGDEDKKLENPSGPGVHALNVYNSGDDMDSESDEISDDDDFGSHNSISDSDDRKVYDTAFVGLAGPDGVWNSEMDDLRPRNIHLKRYGFLRPLKAKIVAGVAIVAVLGVILLSPSADTNISTHDAVLEDSVTRMNQLKGAVWQENGRDLGANYGYLAEDFLGNVTVGSASLFDSSRDQLAIWLGLDIFVLVSPRSAVGAQNRTKLACWQTSSLQLRCISPQMLSSVQLLTQTSSTTS